MTFAESNQATLENRQHERLNLVYDQIPGQFYIRHQNERIELNYVNDVSLSGMGVLVSKELQSGDKIIIGYEADGFSLELKAEVIWHDQCPDKSYRIGVRFSTTNLNINELMLTALKEYID